MEKKTFKMPKENQKENYLHTPTRLEGGPLKEKKKRAKRSKK